jgi:hypothetical protein
MLFREKRLIFLFFHYGCIGILFFRDKYINTNADNKMKKTETEILGTEKNEKSSN